jgi:hypothetical protein
VGGMKERAPVGSSGSLLAEAVLFLLLGRPIVVIMLLSLLYELNVVNRSEAEEGKKIYYLIGRVGHVDVNASCHFGLSACPRAVARSAFFILVALP